MLYLPAFLFCCKTCIVSRKILDLLVRATFCCTNNSKHYQRLTDYGEFLHPIFLKIKGKGDMKNSKMNTFYTQPADYGTQ